MAVAQLDRTIIAKPWGRRDLPAAFGDIANGERIGEIWYQAAAAKPSELLIKHLFTSERLSIQVHPDDETARRLGYAAGKEEAWVVIGAEPGALVGLGLTRAVSAEELRSAALDGTIESLVDWRPAKAGDVFHVPAGTIHSIGAGLLIVEVQQNVDLTFRLYDYGRPRELQLDEAIAAADRDRLAAGQAPHSLGKGREMLISCRKFVIERWRGREGPVATDGRKSVWLIPVSGECFADDYRLAQGQVFECSGEARVCVGAGADLLIAYAGGDIPEFDGA